MDYWKLDASDLLAGFAAHRFSPSEVTADCLARIAAINPAINAVTSLSGSAVAEAAASSERWQQNLPMGPLDGVPILVKENIVVGGMPTTFGSRLYEHYTAERDELPIRRLRAAGAIILGKANCPEFALEGYTANELHGVTGNPFAPHLTSGGSSGGPVSAVAAGLAPIAIGTDGGGSLRRPAAYTGLFGFKPTVGAVARDAGLPQLILDYEVVGPFARSARDIELVHSCLAGEDQGDPASRRRYPAPPSEKKLRILYVPKLGDAPCDPAILSACAVAAEQFTQLGHRVETGKLPIDIGDLNAVWPIFSRTAMAFLRHRNPDFDRLASAKYRGFANEGDRIGARDLYDVMDRIQTMRAEASTAFAHWDIIMTPSCAAMPWPAAEAFPTVIAGQTVGPRGHAIYTAWVNAIHHPAVEVPIYRPKAMPIGFQLVGDMGADAMLIALAQDYERRFIPDMVWPDLARA